MAFLWCLVSAAVLSFAAADYDCLCNYNVELEVHNKMTDSSTPTGSLYEFDCKEVLTTVSVDPGWAAIAYEHKITYVKTGPNTETQVCPGNAPISDRVSITTTGQPTTVATNPTASTSSLTLVSNATAAATTTPPTTTTTQPTTTTTQIPTTVTTTPRPTTITTTPIPTTLTTTLPTTVTTTTAPTTTTPAATTTTTTSTTMPTTTTMTTKPVTFAPSPTTTITTTPPTTTTIKTSPATGTPSAKPPVTTTQTGIISGQTNLCPIALRSFTASDHGILAQYDKSCYELVPHSTTWHDAEEDCQSKGGHLVQINTQGEQDFLYNLVQTKYNLNTWIGLHDIIHEGSYEWSSGESAVYTNWISGTTPHHSSQDCVYLNPHNGGYWVDDHCSSSGSIFSTSRSHRYICQYEIDTNAIVHGTINPHSEGNTHLCPSTVVQHASRHNGFLGQYGQNCYELLPKYDVRWSHGETLCKQEGGHLAHISNADEQKFIQEFTTNHMPNHGAWIGLNDRDKEGHYQWSSGAPMTYTHWVKGHTGVIDNPTREDCILFLPYANGHWDDVPCGTRGFFGFGDSGETHPILCQYGTSHGPPIIG